MMPVVREMLELIEPPMKSESVERRPVLTIGVVLDHPAVPAWIHHMLSHVWQSEGLQTSFIFWTHSAQQQWPEVPLTPRTMMFSAASWLDYHCYRHHTQHPDTTRTVPLSFDPDQVPCCALMESPEGMAVCPEDMARVQAANLQVILDLSSASMSPSLCGLATFGVWSFEKTNPLAATLLRHLVSGKRVFDSRILIRRAEHQPAVFSCSSFAVDLQSLFRNLNSCRWKSVEEVTRQLLRLQKYGWESLEFRLSDASQADASVSPGIWESMQLAGLSLGRAARDQLYRRLWREHWFIAMRSRRNRGTSEQNEGELLVLDPPSDRFYADPFVIERSGQTYVFFEDFRFTEGKGIISFVEIDQDGGRCSQPQVVLERDYHLSYPCVFERDGEMYLLPETGANRTVELYRATDFPCQWQRASVLMHDISAIDPTLLCYRGKFWLFAAGVGNGSCYTSPDDELSLFFSDAPCGPWTPHPKNPVVRDVRRCRPAGQLFYDQGQLIRPAQDSSTVYGRAVVFNRVNVLNETDYQETPIATISPTWFPRNLGTHTFNRSEQWDVVDGRVLIGRLQAKYGNRSGARTYRLADHEFFSSVSLA